MCNYLIINKYGYNTVKCEQNAKLIYGGQYFSGGKKKN